MSPPDAGRLAFGAARPGRADRYLGRLLALPAAACAMLLVLVCVFLVKESWPVLTAAGHDNNWIQFLGSQGWYPMEGRFGMAPMFLASVAATVGAVTLALPFGLASAVFLLFYAPATIAGGYRLLLNLLAGIPSVVYGLWGLTRLVPLIAGVQPPGTSLLAATAVLALMILPTVALTGAAALAAVPREWLAGAAALGLMRHSQILFVAIPAARAGIMGGVLLATARALGETMAVLMVAGNVVQIPSGLFEPVRVLTANIALEMGYAMGNHRAGLFASGLLLTLAVWLLALLASRSVQTAKTERRHV